MHSVLYNVVRRYESTHRIALRYNVVHVRNSGSTFVLLYFRRARAKLRGTLRKKYYPAILLVRSSDSRISTANTHTLQPSYYVRVLPGFKLQSFERGARGRSRAAGVAGASQTPSSHAKNLLKRPR